MAIEKPISGAQMALGVKLRDEARFSNFHGGRNRDTALRLPPLLDDPNLPVVVLCGDRDTGKSHLLQASCHYREQQGATTLCLSLAELGRSGPQALEGLPPVSLLALDDLDLIAGAPQWEEAIFHLYNRVLDQGGQLLISLANTPAASGFALQDLMSRLQLAVVLQLGINRDEDRLTILRARAEQRGLVLSDEVASFLLKRAPRSMAELLRILDQLDENSLQARRRLTIPFVKTVLGW